MIYALDLKDTLYRLKQWLQPEQYGEPHQVLRSIFRQMAKDDQAARIPLEQLPKASSATKEQREHFSQKLSRVDEAHLSELKRIFCFYNWGDIARLGPRACHDAWLLVQHADMDSDFQERMLEQITHYAKNTENPASKNIQLSFIAYLTDRVAVNKQRPQLYGTQYMNDGEPHHIQNPEGLANRRKEMGLEPITQYAESMRAKCEAFSQYDL